jgi:hypothetical protein
VKNRSRTLKNRVESPANRRSDEGVTLIEILIGIVLLGTVVSATLTGLITVITAGTVHRDHANAHAWLQTGADMLYARELYDCDPAIDATTEISNTIAAYEATVQQTDNPEGWSAGNIQVTGVKWWRIDIDPASGVGTEGWGEICDSADTNLQRVSLQVTSQNGRIVEQVEVIISD